MNQRLSMDAAGVIAHYVMDTSSSLSAGSDRLLTAETGGNKTYYLYGLGAIGEKTTAWNFSLPDGTNTPRQLSNNSGEITLSTRYTPWGDTLEVNGTGNFAFGYFGGVMDAATGLIYVGNGQYYDPETGRFLTRDAKPNNTNPYVPWDPSGAIIAPLGIVALFAGRKKKGSKVGTFLVLLIVLGSVGMTLAACKLPPGPVEATFTATPGAPIQYNITPSSGPVISGTLPATPGAPSTPIAIPCPTPAPTQTAISMLTSGYYIPTESQVTQKYAGYYPVPAPSWVERPAFLVRYDSREAAKQANVEWSKNWADGFPAQKANEGLLYHHDFICTQGSGKLDISANGHYITCDTDYYWQGFLADDAPNSWTPSTREKNIGFRWADESEDGLLKSLIPYYTVAVCPGTQLHGEIQVVGLEEAQMKKLRDNGNTEAKFTVVDVGEGLCPPNNDLGEKYLDIYTGEGANAANDAILFYSQAVQVIQH